MTKMYMLSLLVLAVCVFGAYALPVLDDPIAFKNATWAKCQKQENAPDDAMKDFYNFKSAEGLKDYKCVAKCVQEEYGLIDKNGLSNIEMVVKIIKSLWKNPEVNQKLIELTQECIKSANPGAHECQMNYDILSCFIEGIKKRNINIGRRTT